jgi:magnesium transporter
MPLDPPFAGDHVTFESAAQHVSTDVPVAEPACTAGALRQTLVSRRYDSASHVVVCEGDRFRGVARIEDVLSAPATATLAELMDRDAPVVGPGVDQEKAAWRAVQKGEAALSVVDGGGRFVGVIPPHRLLAVLLSEHEEDLSRLGGFLKSTAAARTTSEEPVERRFWHRLPWLLLGLGGALLAAHFVGWFETQLQHRVMLAFFIPGIVYLADAVGTQTETVVVRGLSVGVPMRRVVGRELLAGLVIGVALGAIGGASVWWGWGETDIAWCVGLSLLAACSTATVAAMALPWMFDALGFDPAFASGPLATVIQDLASILIYFSVATVVV